MKLLILRGDDKLDPAARTILHLRGQEWEERIIVGMDLGECNGSSDDNAFCSFRVAPVDELAH